MVTIAASTIDTPIRLSNNVMPCLGGVDAPFPDIDLMISARPLPPNKFASLYSLLAVPFDAPFLISPSNSFVIHS